MPTNLFLAPVTIIGSLQEKYKKFGLIAIVVNLAGIMGPQQLKDFRIC
jgi:hypothetical protein